MTTSSPAGTALAERPASEMQAQAGPTQEELPQALPVPDKLVAECQSADDDSADGTPSPNRRWLALAVLCLGTLMIVLDTTIVNVALPSIRSDLGFSETSLAWVVNAYMLTYGGFLLLGGRLGDLFGRRRLFVTGITAFGLASLACGLA
ncbi:MAG: MFS transporter, partial [Nocardiopsaceae bacterium]|nr:MFS transporter [Nocardiopsaceae bacterium]